jgi:hypothetical protein
MASPNIVFLNCRHCNKPLPEHRIERQMAHRIRKFKNYFCPNCLRKNPMMKCIYCNVEIGFDISKFYCKKCLTKRELNPEHIPFVSVTIG